MEAPLSVVWRGLGLGEVGTWRRGRGRRTWSYHALGSARAELDAVTIEVRCRRRLASRLTLGYSQVERLPLFCLLLCAYLPCPQSFVQVFKIAICSMQHRAARNCKALNLTECCNQAGPAVCICNWEMGKCCETLLNSTSTC